MRVSPEWTGIGLGLLMNLSPCSVAVAALPGTSFDTPLGGHWGLAVIMILVASWMVSKFLVPKSWKEWRSAGLVQAFIIALYAEMYGFPLTIYLLTSVFDLDIPWLHGRGHLWATLLGYGETGAAVEMFIGYGLVMTGLVLVVRGWKRIYYQNKEEGLVTDGLYAYVRHPQYTGILLLVTGQIIHWPTILTVILYPFIVFAYVRLARKEEQELLQKHEERYRKYMQKTPMLFPRLKQGGS